MNLDDLKFKVSEDVKALIPKKKLTSLIETFAQLDFNQNGKIEIDEYLNYSLKKEKLRLTKQFEAFDTDKDGCVDFEEFVAATEPNFSILKKFLELDCDRNGLLSIEEAINIADCLALPFNVKQIQTIMIDADGDDDGQISYYEYLGAIAHIGFQ